MCYFSELDIRRKDEYADRSYYGTREQLLSRYEELKERYAELLRSDAACFCDERFGADDYRYAPIECFRSIEDVYRAMEIAREDLCSECDIILQDDIESVDAGEDEEEDSEQITLFEVVLLPSWFQTALAA